MFHIELDVHLVFSSVPTQPADDIVITRSFDLPFVPYPGLHLHGSTWEAQPATDGLELTHVLWDVDRQAFLATARHADSQLPASTIPGEIEKYLAHGWRLGSSHENVSRDHDYKPAGSNSWADRMDALFAVPSTDSWVSYVDE